MTAAQWTHVESLFEAALDQPPAQHEAWLAATCDDETVREEVRAMLAACQPSTDFLEDSAAVLAAGLILDSESEAAPLEAGMRVGPYRLVREIGRGGMGVVYLAERDDGQFEQRVAIKLLRRDTHTETFRARFLAERQILATLDHPNIARLFDGGVTEDGRPFYVMAHVEGRPITHYCDEEHLSIPDRLRLFGQVCDAVAYAHRQLVVHRDIKPSNVLVEDGTGDWGLGNGRPRLQSRIPHPSSPRVKLLDFGIARLLSDDAPAATPSGQRLLTLAYAAPEQIRDEPVSTATDVYALGVLLYELLTGHRPFRADSRQALRQAILETESAAPSRTIEAADAREALAEARRTTPARLQRRLRGDLDSIVAHALHKDSHRRYPSAEALGRDVERHLAGLPVDARPATLRYRAASFVKRHRIGVVLTAGLAGLAVLAGGLHASRVTAERDRAEDAAQRAERVSTFLTDLISRADDPTASRLVLLHLLEPALADADDDLMDDPAARATVYHTVGVLYGRLGRGDLADSLLARALVLRDSLHDGPHPALAATHYQRGLYLLDNDQEAALSHVRTSAEMRRQFAEGDDSDLAWSLLQWARFLPHDHPDKRRQFGEAMAMMRRVHGARSLQVANALHEFHVLGLGSRDGAEIERAFRESISIYREIGQEQHPYALHAMHNLGLMLDGQGRRSEALPLLERSVRIGREALPEDDHELVTMEVNYGATLHEYGRFQEADAVLREVATRARRLFGDEASSVAQSHYWHGRNLLALGRPEEAEGILRLALDVFLLQDPENPRRYRIQAELGDALRQRGRTAEAERLLVDAVEHLHGEYPEERALGQLLRLYVEEGRRSEAAAIQSRLDERRS